MKREEALYDWEDKYIFINKLMKNVHQVPRSKSFRTYCINYGRTSRDRTYLFGVSIEVTIRCYYVFLSSLFKDENAGYKIPFATSFSVFIASRCTSLETESHCLLSIFFIRGKSQMELGQGNKMSVEVLGRDGRPIVPETCEPTHYSNEAPAN
ncbi:hypothetical protein AVEN_116347-1 [Araneus ventricosus]|uniref:Uncharacterized protein n=1 Tax=Araneus ventricosus TaxID=182803 RepID=A0A4Y2KNM3_ARAVE|nr:hypothetical protein AVEN_116347-1 [Araneus ventricosus]